MINLNFVPIVGMEENNTNKNALIGSIIVYMDALSLHGTRSSTKLEKTSLSTDVFQGSFIDYYTAGKGILREDINDKEHNI